MDMVSVAQLVEPRIVIPVVVGSSPIVHPIFGAVPTRRPGTRTQGRQLKKTSGQPIIRYVRDRRETRAGTVSGGAQTRKSFTFEPLGFIWNRKN